MSLSNAFRALFVASLCLVCTSLLLAQATPSRILDPVDDSDVVTLYGNTHPLALPEYDRGPIPLDSRLDRMVLVLAPDPAQQQALDQLSAAQQDPASPSYHQWLTPAQYGSRFGVSSADIARLTAWLHSYGFSVEPAPVSRRVLVFSGTAAQVADAFHVELHRYLVEGVEHIANSQDPQVPRALAPVISGVLSLHNFRSASQIAARHSLPHASITPLETQSSSVHYLFPGDFATIYDLNPLYSAGTKGSGVTIAIVGRSNINLSDVASFRSFAALPANQPTIVFDGANPGLVSGDQDEATLDVEWSGAVAPAATIKLVAAASSATTDGVDLSAAYIVNNKLATVMSTSFGNCEANMGSSENSFYNSLWQQAATEGISAFVSAGDSGAAGCNGGSDASASVAGVNALCSSPYSTCVGGTEFNEGSGNYWSSTNGSGGASALSYIPEEVWNESASNGGSGLWASGGGISKIYQQPTWQQDVQGANSNGMRAVPDVALSASVHDGYLVCENGNFYVFGGTSASSPSFAGIQSLVVQKTGGTGQGNANPTLYHLLVSSSPFHPTPSGNNSVPGVSGFTAASAPYNLATGLGSVDAKAFVNAWPTGGATTTIGFTLNSASSSESIVQGASATSAITLTSLGGYAGTVALTASAPTGVSVSFNPTSIKPGQSSTVTITVASSATPGTGNVVLTATASPLAQSLNLPITILGSAKLALSALPIASVVQGKTTTLPVSVVTSGAFSGAVTLAVTDLPSGVTAAWSTNNFSPGAATTTSTLTITASASATLGTVPVTITATGDSLSGQTPLYLSVAAPPSVQLSLSATTLSMNSTASQTLIAKVTLAGGVSPTLPAGAAFSVTGLPTGVTASWSAPALVSGLVQSTLTLTGSGTARISSQSLSITAAITNATDKIVYNSTQTATLAVTMTPALTVTPASSSLTVQQGATATNVISIATGGSFSTPVTLALTGLPSGVTATWSSSSVTPTGANGAATSTLTLTASSTVTVATAPLTITASGDGISATAPVTLQISIAPAISLALSTSQLSMVPTATQTLTAKVTLVGGVSPTLPAGAAFSVTGLPTGVTAAWSAPTLTNGIVQSTLTLTGSTTARAGVSTLAIAASIIDCKSAVVYKASQPATLTLPPSLTASAATSALTITQGKSATDLLSIATANSFTTPVTFSVGTLPAGITATFSPVSVTPAGATGSATSALTIAATNTAAAGSVPVVVTATGGGITAQTTITVQINAAPAISLALSSSQLSMKPTSTSTLITAVTLGGGVSPTLPAGAAFSVTGLPTGVTGKWSAPTLANGVIQSTLTLTGSTTARAGVSTLTIAASITDSKSAVVYKASQPATLTLTPSLTASAASTSLTLAQDKSATDVLSIATADTFLTPVTLSVGTLPAGVTATFSPASVTPAGPTGAATSILTIAVSASAAVGSVPVVVTATGGGITAQATITLQINTAPAISLAPTAALTMGSTATTTLTVPVTLVGGVSPTLPTGAIFSVTGLPTGVTAKWSTPVKPTNTSVQSVLTLTGSSTARASSETLTITATVTDATSKLSYKATQAAALTVTMTPALAFTSSVSSLAIVRGKTAIDSIAASNHGTFLAPITFAIAGLPTHVTASWSTNPVSPASYLGTASSTLTLSPATTASAGSYRLTITATGSGITATQYLTITLK